MRFSLFSVQAYCWGLEEQRLKTFSKRWLYALHGTVWLKLILRALGAKIGQGAYIEDMNMYEPWLIEVSDGATLNPMAKLCPHSVDNTGSLVLRRVRVGRGATMLDQAMIHGGTSVPPDVVLGTRSRYPLRGAAC